MPIEFDSQGNLHVGPFTRFNSGSRITVDFEAGDTTGIALDASPSPTGASERAAIKLGDFVIGQDLAKNGTKDFGILNGDGVKVANLGAVGLLHYQFDVPLIVLPTGSIADGGVLTSGTANPLTYLKTFCWFPLAALYATTTTPASATDSPAGWYYTVFTTTTAAQVYANTWDGASAPTIPTTLVSLDATAGTGPGAFTGPTTEAAYISLPIPALTVNSRLVAEIETQQTNNANVKSASFRMTNVAGTVYGAHVLTSFLHARCTTTIKVNGVADKQRVTNEKVTAAAIARATPALAAETTSAAFTLAVTVAKATATDVVVIETLRISQAG